MSQIKYTPEQRKRAYADLIASCRDPNNLPWLLDKAVRLYGALKLKDLEELLSNHPKR